MPYPQEWLVSPNQKKKKKFLLRTIVQPFTNDKVWPVMDFLELNKHVDVCGTLLDLQRAYLQIRIHESLAISDSNN